MKKNKNISLLIIFLLSMFVISNLLLVPVSADNKGLSDFHNKMNGNGDDENEKTVINEKLQEYINAGILTEKEYKQITESSGLLNKVNNKIKLSEAINAFMENYHKILNYATTFGALSSFLIFILIFLRLTFMPSHPTEKRKAMMDIIVSGISTALLGGMSLIINLFYDSFDTIIENGLMYSLKWEITFNALLYEYRILIIGVFGIATLTLILMFIKHFLQLAANANNPRGRAESLKGLLMTGIGAMGIGGITFWVAFFSNIFK